MFYQAPPEAATPSFPRSGPPVPMLAEAGSGAMKRTMARCSACARRSVCMPLDLSVAQIARLDTFVRETRPVRRGQPLYLAGDRFQNFYAIRTGSFKFVTVHRDGLEQISSFFVAGETLGLDGVSSGSHAGDAIALEESSACVIPFAALEAFCAESRAMQHHLHRLMSEEIVRQAALVMLLGTMKAEQRVAAFLLNLSERVGRQGYPRSELALRMSREEIGNYLGLKLETVSRMLSKLTRQGLVEIRAKRIRIVDFGALARV